MLEPRGVFHHKGKDITFTVKKSLYMMSFPPSFPSREQQRPRKGGEAMLEGAAMPRGAFRSGRAMSIRLPSSVVFSRIYFFFSTWGIKRKKRCYPKNCRLRQRSSEKEYIIIYRRIQLLGHLGKSLVQEQWEGQKRLHIPLCNRKAIY